MGLAALILFRAFLFGFLFGLVSIFCRALYMMNHGFDAVPAASQDIPGISW